MGEFIINVQEKIENNIGDVLEERKKALKNFKGLGPPDLCVLTKSYEPPKFVPGLKSTKLSSYHWVMGVNASSASSIAAYVGGLIENQEKSSFGRGIYRIESCHFICFNSFLKMDLHVEFTIAGNKASPPIVYSVGIDSNTSTGGNIKNENNVEEEFWKEAFISGMLRRIQGPPPFLRPVKVLPMFKDAREENEFIKQSQLHFWSGRKLGGYDSTFIDMNSKDEGLEIDDGNNLLVTTLSNYFTMKNRFLPMLSFFEGLQNTEPSVSIPISVALRLMTCGNDALDVLESSLEKAPNSVSILMELSKTLIHLAKRENPVTNAPRIQNLLLRGLGYILKAISLGPKVVRAWSIASNILFLLGSVEWSLIFLNNSPVVKVDYTVDRIGKTTYARVTSPPEHPNISNVIEDEELEFDEEPGDEVLKCLTSVSLNGDALNYFSYLVTMYKKIGWTALVDKKVKVLDEITKHKIHNSVGRALGGSANTLVVDGNKNQTPTKTSTNSQFKESHNALSPTNKHKATENTLTDSTDGTSEIRQQIQEDPNIQKEALWRDDDVTSEGSDIENDQESTEEKSTNASEEKKEEEEEKVEEELQQQQQQLKDIDLSSPIDDKKETEISNGTNTTTTSQPIQREEFKNHSELKIENLSEILSTFIDNYGVDSLKERANKDYIILEFGQDTILKARVPVIAMNRNLELAFHSLFQDIKAYQSWRDEAETKKLDILPQQTLKHMNPMRTSSDWIRLARLSYRLGELDEAEKIYKWIFDDTKFNPRAILGLTIIFTEHNDIRDSLMSSSSVLKYYFSEKVKCTDMHPSVERSLLNLISINGLQKVRNIHGNLHDSHPSINNLFLDSVKWRSWGYDR